MKSLAKIIPMILVLTLAAWAQTATQNPSSTGDTQKAPAVQSDSQTAGCPCCQKMADSKEGMKCSAKQCKGKDGAMACCNGKDGKSCMKGDKSAKASCAGDKCCASKNAKNCCSGSDKDDKMAMACCGDGQCGMGHHDHETMDK
jgi:hypothetical protein